jgi:tRNA(fMet)-specific endonuclease VapC
LIHFDTNIAIALLNDRPPQVRAKFEAARAARTPFAMSMIVYYELMYGAAASKRRKANEDKIAVFMTSGGIALLPFEAADAAEAADIRSDLKRTGRPIGPYDLLIAAQARRARTTLITANAREFERVPGLVAVDWAG